MSHHHHDHYDGEDPHDHSHDGHSHDHSDDITPALQNLLYSQIDFSALTCLNESEPRSGAAICQKTWQQRMEDTPELHSDADEQLLMHIPFAGQVKLHSILIRTGQDDSAPSTLKVFVNKEHIDFSTASELDPTQTLQLAQSSDVQEYPVKRALFNTTRSLTLFFEDNWGHGDEDVTKIAYLGFKGEFMKLSKEPVSFLYEAAANPADHKIKGTDTLQAGHHIGG
jgi:PITH domain